MTGFRLPGPVGLQDPAHTRDHVTYQGTFKPGVLRKGHVRPEHFGLIDGRLYMNRHIGTVSFFFQISSGTLTLVSRHDCRTMRATSGRPDSCMNKADVLCQMLKNTGLYRWDPITFTLMSYQPPGF